MSRSMVSFAEVKRAVSVEALMAHYGLLDGFVQRGANRTGRCPFCRGQSERQFRVSPEKNVWYCFGCKQGGNVLDFVAKKEGITLRAAAVALDEWFGLRLAVLEGPRQEAVPPPVVPAVVTDEPQPNQPLTFALKTLDPTHESVAALGLPEATIRAFGLGFCTKGLLKGRIAIPVHNSGGDLVAYAGLATDGDLGPRYLFPPRFQPVLEVFNLHRLRERAPGARTVYLAPEILGVLRLAAAGFPFLVGLFDGTLAETQEAALTAVLAEDSRLVLVGGGFEPSVFERLSRTFTLRNLTSVAALSPEPGEPEVP